MVYLDNASTTKVDEQVIKEMLPFFDEYFGNASSNHEFGQLAKVAVEKSRRIIGKLINADSDEIIFTSGSTEAINLAIKGYVESNYENGNHIITVKTEHKAVLSTCEYLETKGVEVTYLDVDENGLIDLKALKNSIRQDTFLIVVMYVNNEIGIIQPINEVGKIAKENNITFFCDATQAVGKIPVDVKLDNIDMLCLSAHKINGPKGIGALYKRRNINLTPIIHGGGQENGLRGGTYNTPLIVGFGKAVELVLENFYENIKEKLEYRKAFEDTFESRNVGVINFKNQNRIPNISCISLFNEEGEDYLLQHKNDFAASTGAACNSDVMELSYVFIAVFGTEKAKKTIRISY